MQYVEVAGVRVSRVGLGTWQFGAREWGYGADYAHRTAGALVQRALDLGIDLIDTAEVYAFGESERIVGRALGDRRTDAFVATKLFPVAPIEQVVRQRAAGSARRLGVDRIDLYQLHGPNPLVPARLQAAALRALQDEGLVDHVGVSNHSADRWFALEEALGAPVLSNQVRYSLVDRRAERDVVPYAQRCDRLVIAYSPLGQGLLGGRYDADHPPTGSARRTNPLFLPDNLESARPLLDALREVAGAHDATPAQVALAWVLCQPNVVVIPGASSVAQLEANAAAADLELAPDEVAALGDASLAFSPRTGLAVAPDLVRARLGIGV